MNLNGVGRYGPLGIGDVSLFSTLFVCIHKTLRVTPAIAAGATDRLWEVSDIEALLEAVEPKPGKRAVYKWSVPNSGALVSTTDRLGDRVAFCNER